MKFRPPSLALVFIVAAIYFGAAELGLSLAFAHNNVSPVWPPTGVAIASVLSLGYRVLPGIFLGAFLANLATGVSIATAGGIAVGNTLEALSAAFLLHRFIGSRYLFNRALDVLKYVLLAGLLSTMVSATIGNLSLCLSGAAVWANFGWLWLTWWLGDGGGALVVAPLLLTWTEKPRERWPPERLAEAALMLVLLSIVAFIIFGGLFFGRAANYPLEHLTIPFLLWAAFRFGQRGVVTAITILLVIAVWGTTRGFGPFVGGDPNQSLLLVQVFVDAVAIISLFLAAVLTEQKQAEETRLREQSFSDSAIDSLPGIFYLISEPGQFLRWNKNLEKITGYSAEEIARMHPLDFFAGEDKQLIAERIQEVFVEGEATAEAELVAKDGRRTPYFFTGRRIALNQNRCLIGMGIDITWRKRAEENVKESERRFRQLAENINEVFWMSDPEVQQILYVGPAYEEIWGRTCQSLYEQPKSFLDAVHPEDRERLAVKLAWQMEGKPTDEEYRIIRPDGSVRWIRDRAFPIKNEAGRVVRVTGVAEDITERKRIEEERAELLGREQAARARAEEASRLKDEFLATVSHELRTPLNAILGWAIMLRGGKLSAAAAERAIETIERNAKSQAQIIEDILDVSRIITGRLRLNVHAVELAPMVEMAIETVRPAAEAKGMQLQSFLDTAVGPISGDPDRLQQIVWNLLSNAVKFTPRGGRVQVRLERINSHVEIIVSDTGQGISREFLPHVFDRFRQADSSSTRAHGGLGLGLAIVRHLVELHGGSVRAESPGEGQGATFIVRLPVALIHQARGPLKSAAKEEPSLKSTPDLRGLSVLLVDDEVDTRELLTAMLEQYGAEVKSAASAAQALDMLEEWRPSVLVADIGMPDEDGYDFIKKVRARGIQIPAIALTAYARSEDRLRALAASYQMHVSKPVEPVELAVVVASLPGRSPGE
jgi:PAS domain S-box-containing protein